ncbi:MAG: hypothetical protein J6Q22_10315 [Prevotella sp.]|nr:hypothetical protein [Prevotella sp.]
MANNYYRFVFDERARTEKLYKDLTDDDIRYLEAVARHDYGTTSALLDKYFRQKMPNTRAKRVVWRRDNKRDIWVYQVHRKNKSDAGWLDEGIYFYGAEEEAWKAVEYGYWMQGFYINVEAPFIMDRDIHDALVHHNDGKISERLTAYLGSGKLKMDGVFWAGDMREEWCIFDAKQMKRAEVTRDNEGRVIPLSRRFDLDNPDNRY